MHRLVRDEAHRLPAHPREPDHDVLRIQLVDLHEIAVVDDPVNDLAHVIRTIGFRRDDGQEFFVEPIGVVGVLDEWRVFSVI